MGIDPIFHHMMQSALKEIDDSEVLETRAASRRDRAAAQLKQLAELDDEQLLSVLPGTGEGFRQVLQSAREGIQNGLYAMAAVQLQELADQADDQSQAVSSQENAVCEMLQSALKEIQDSEVLETQAASRRDRATAHLKQLAELNEKQLLSVLPEKGPSLHQTLQVALKAIEDHQYATATGQLKQLANLPDKLLAPAREKLSAQEKLSARWTITLQTRLRAVLTEQTIPAVDPEKCRTLETQLYKHLQGKDFAEALKTLDQLEPSPEGGGVPGQPRQGQGAEVPGSDSRPQDDAKTIWHHRHDRVPPGLLQSHSHQAAGPGPGQPDVRSLR